MTPKKRETHPIIAFADGASSGNPGPGGWGAIIATPEGHVTELGGGYPEVTNNQMELMGTIQTLSKLKGVPGEVGIYTDSTYVIQGITKWIWAWRNRGWKTAEGKDVSNADLWKKLFALVAARGKEGKVAWHYVRGHSGVPGNERVDEIAVLFSKGKRPSLYDGPLLRYEIPIHDLPDDTSVPERSMVRPEKVAAHSYLSLVNDKPMRHATWKDCEARVKGRSGAKFKKALAPQDESKILAEWGFKPEDVD